MQEVAADLERLRADLERKDLTPEDILALSRLPSLEVLHGQLVGVIASPLTGLVRGLGSMISGLAIALGQIQEKGLVGGDAPAPEAPAEAETGSAPQPQEGQS